MFDFVLVFWLPIFPTLMLIWSPYAWIEKGFITDPFNCLIESLLSSRSLLFSMELVFESISFFFINFNRIACGLPFYLESFDLWGFYDTLLDG
jgi:hypothetical protein